MVIDALRGYAQLANGLTDVTRQKAAQVARQIVDQGGGLVVGVASSNGSAEIARQVQGLAEDLLATSRTNRDLLVGLVRTEVERAVGRLGLVGADELSAMARVVERLQNQLDAAIAFGGRGSGTSARPSGAGATDEASAGVAPGRRSARREPVKFAAPTAQAKVAPTEHPAKKTAKKTARKAAKKTTEKTAKKTVTTTGTTAKKAVRKVAPRTAPTSAAPAPAGADVAGATPDDGGQT
ncbi:MAG: polyhydroxyalkanoate synthesis protein PhaF [Actinomycetes bacterium]